MQQGDGFFSGTTAKTLYLYIQTVLYMVQHRTAMWRKGTNHESNQHLSGTRTRTFLLA